MTDIVRSDQEIARQKGVGYQPRLAHMANSAKLVAPGDIDFDAKLLAQHALDAELNSGKRLAQPPHWRTSSALTWSIGFRTNMRIIEQVLAGACKHAAAEQRAGNSHHAAVAHRLSLEPMHSWPAE
jgi:hypothetical protein